MRGNKTLLIVAVLLIILVVVAGGVYFYMQTQKAPEVEELAEATPTPEPVVYTDIVIAMQNISRGLEIKVEDNAIALQRWPQDALPPEYYTSLEEIDGKFARMDIPRGMPVLPNMLGAPGGMLAASGSAAALFEPADRVAYAIPMDTQGAVAWALKPGDRVDVIAALSTYSVDPQVINEGVKQFMTLIEDPQMPVQTGNFGHFELLPHGLYGAVTGVSTSDFTSLIVQLTVQDAIVWHVGLWEDVEASTIESTTPVTPAVTGGGGGGLLGGGGAAAPAATPEVAASAALVEYRDVEPVTLLVSREDALILKYLMEMGADLDLVLRSAGFTGTVIQTQPVWFRYILDKYQLPDTMPTDLVAPAPVRAPLEVPPMATPEPVE
ncbi:MAG: Flp pilus assembly protein CpaB [Anaerolineae bacterium]